MARPKFIMGQMVMVLGAVPAFAADVTTEHDASDDIGDGSSHESNYVHH